MVDLSRRRITQVSIFSIRINTRLLGSDHILYVTHCPALFSGAESAATVLGTPPRQSGSAAAVTPRPATARPRGATRAAASATFARRGRPVCTEGSVVWRETRAQSLSAAVRRPGTGSAASCPGTPARLEGDRSAPPSPAAGTRIGRGGFGACVTNPAIRKGQVRI